jgi:hypothetical protein
MSTPYYSSYRRLEPESSRVRSLGATGQEEANTGLRGRTELFRNSTATTTTHVKVDPDGAWSINDMVDDDDSAIYLYVINYYTVQYPNRSIPCNDYIVTPWTALSLHIGIPVDHL